MTILEAFADAMMRYEGWKPAVTEKSRGSMSWRNRNPGNLRSSRLATEHEGGYAVFPSLAVGYQAMLDDITAKCKGKPYTRTELGPESSLLEFFQIWAPSSDGNHPRLYAAFVSRCLTITTRLPFSIESKLKEIYPG